MTRQPLFRAAARALEDHIRAVASSQIADGRDDITSAGVQRLVRSEFAGDLARFITHIYGDDQARATEARDLQALQTHAALAEDHDRVSHPQLCGLHCCDTVAQGLQTRRFAVGDPVVHLHEGDLRQRSDFGETTGKVEPDDRALAAEIAPLGTAERALPARQLGPRCDTVAGTEPARAIDFDDTGAELMSEELDRRFGFEAAFDAFEGQCWDSLRKLCLCDARLDTKRLD